MVSQYHITLYMNANFSEGLRKHSTGIHKLKQAQHLYYPFPITLRMDTSSTLNAILHTICGSVQPTFLTLHRTNMRNYIMYICKLLYSSIFR